MRDGGHLRHPLLSASGVWHGFGTREASRPQGCLRPRQVHGDVAVLAPRRSWDAAPEADAIVSLRPGPPVGVVTADCVPILVAAGEAVAAVHAGWRGLARGVIGRALELLGRHCGGARPIAVIGPHIGRCCYEVDAPVIDALGLRFVADLEDALTPSRAGHHRLDLGMLVRRELERAGLDASGIGRVGGCTFCDAEHFHSYRRDGPRAGRLLHFVAPQPPPESS